jgi:hypothetical protein
MKQTHTANGNAYFVASPSSTRSDPTTVSMRERGHNARPECLDLAHRSHRLFIGLVGVSRLLLHAFDLSRSRSLRVHDCDHVWRIRGVTIAAG